MFVEDYPNLAWWINNHGWIEIGNDEFNYSMVRVLDIGGTCWEDKKSNSFEESLEKAERWASTEIEERFDEAPPRRYNDKSDE
jgi:hypothetical protein